MEFPADDDGLPVLHATAAKTLGRVSMLVSAASLSALSSETVWSDLGRKHCAIRNAMGLKRSLCEVCAALAVCVSVLLCVCVAVAASI